MSDLASARLLISCPDGPGIVAAVSSFLFEQGANILESEQHSTVPVGRDAKPQAEATILAELTRMGADIERVVLARAVQWHLEDRVLVDGNKTVVFA